MSDQATGDQRSATMRPAISDHATGDQRLVANERSEPSIPECSNLGIEHAPDLGTQRYRPLGVVKFQELEVNGHINM
jgi:hypothetical protein